MNNHIIRIAAKVFFLLLLSFHLNATVYTYNATIDITSPFSVSNSGGEWNYVWIFSGAPTFTLQSGDTVQGTISFTGNDALQFLGPAYSAGIYLEFADFFSSGPLPSITSVSTTTLNGVAGYLTSQNPTSATSSGAGSFNPGVALVSTPTAASFNGFSYSGTVTSGSGDYMPNIIRAGSHLGGS